MIQDLLINRTEIDFGLDSVIVRKFTNGIEGGITLDLSNYTDSTVLAGQAVITNGEVYRPMPVIGDVYDDMPEGFRFFGVIYRSSKATQGVSVMTRGVVNRYRAPYEFRHFYEDYREDNPYIILAADTEEMEEYARLEARDGVIVTSDGYEIWFRTRKKQ